MERRSSRCMADDKPATCHGPHYTFGRAALKKVQPCRAGVWIVVAVGVSLSWALMPLKAQQKAQETVPGSDGTIRLSDGRIQLPVPKSWQARRPQTRIVEYEFAAPAAEGDSNAARITIMGAGGGVDANIARWIDQFEQPDGSPSKEKTQVEKKTIAGVDVHIVSITGTYKDRPSGGPFAGGQVVRRPGYRMLGAIIVAPNLGHYYIKMYGPQKTVDQQEAAFKEMLHNLKVQMPN